MIVALAGHVDHGKTSLVKALTGVDTDRLEEERRRGLTIDLGFAYTDLAGKRIGFVDVPGHHRFVHNMVAGVASRQVALLVIAADDGPMPQTREHLDILCLLGLRRGIVALTKTDLVSEQRIGEARTEIAALVAGTFLQDAQCVALSIVNGHGIDELRTLLADAASDATDDVGRECFRLAIDRAFNVKGAGLVVTGTVHSGRCNAGDELLLAPPGERVRVRAIRAQDRPAEHGLPGDRCALNIVGVDRDAVARGMWLVAPEAYFATTRLVVRLEVLRAFPRAVRHWTPVHVHHATDHTTGRIVLLDSGPIAPGARARVEVELDRPIHPKRGDRIVVRDHAGSCTLGGGDVIDIDPPRAGRRKAERLTRLDFLAAPTAAESLRALLSHCDDGLDEESFRQNWNLPSLAFDELLTGHRTRTMQAGGRRWIVAAERVEGLEGHVVERLGAYHKAAPYSAGLRVDRLRQVVPSPVQILDAALDALSQGGKVSRTNGYYHLSTHRPKLAPDDETLLQRLVALLEGRQPPSIGDAAKQLRIDLTTLHTFVDRMSALGLLVRVSDTRCFLPKAIAHLERIATGLSGHADGFTAAEFRDAAGIGRNLAIDVLEHFDRRGVTRRHGERRRALATNAH